MKTSAAIRLVAALCLIALLLGMGGCYSKVVGGKGIGADSQKLRKNHEFGSPSPMYDIVEREEKR